MKPCYLLVALLLAMPTLVTAREDIVIADFEGDTYGLWQADGEAFGTGPAAGTLPGQMPVSGFEGKRLVNTFLHGDRTTGTLTSPPIAIERDYLTFLIGGGALSGFDAELLDFSIEFAATEKTKLTIDLRGERVEYRDGPLFYDKSRIPAEPVEGAVALRALVDRASIELFANHGAAISTHYATPDANNTRVSITSNHDVQIKSLTAHKLKSAWSK